METEGMQSSQIEMRSESSGGELGHKGQGRNCCADTLDDKYPRGTFALFHIGGQSEEKTQQFCSIRCLGSQRRETVVKRSFSKITLEVLADRRSEI